MNNSINSKNLIQFVIFIAEHKLTPNYSTYLIRICKKRFRLIRSSSIVTKINLNLSVGCP